MFTLSVASFFISGAIVHQNICIFIGSFALRLGDQTMTYTVRPRVQKKNFIHLSSTRSMPSSVVSSTRCSQDFVNTQVCKNLSYFLVSWYTIFLVPVMYYCIVCEIKNSKHLQVQIL